VIEESGCQYFPPPESKGGWRWLRDDEEIRSVAGMDPEKLANVLQHQLFLYGSDSWSVAIIRRGYLVKEYATFNVLVPTRFDIWSGTKSVTGTAWGLLLEDSKTGKIPNGLQVGLNDTAYQFLPEGYPLSDKRKEKITIEHLLTMTSGIAGAGKGIIGMGTEIGYGPFEHALGKCPNRFGKGIGELIADPGTVWDYSDPAFAHLSLMFWNIMKEEMRDYLHRRVFIPIGVEELSWDVQGGSGCIGPHTNAHTGIHVSARDLARFGYLYLRRGRWLNRQIIPEWWIDLATRSSQLKNPNYGYSWWVNTSGTYWPGLPKDMYSLQGYDSNRCYVIPSLDLVVVRTGNGPSRWDESHMISGVVKAVLN
jgi:CubicO group peptidase (beta-lactamase class C family)